MSVTATIKGTRVAALTPQEDDFVKVQDPLTDRPWYIPVRLFETIQEDQ